MRRCPRLPAAPAREATRRQRHAARCYQRLTRVVLMALFAFIQGSTFLCLQTNAHAASALHTPLAERDAITFAVVAGVPQMSRQAPRTQSVLRWIARQPDLDFIVHLGNLRTATDPCSDSLFTSREAILNATPAPLIFVPGENDWATCDSAPGGGDPIERLDTLRDSFFSGAMSLGNPGLRLIRQSELPAYRPYRENTRWITHGVVFVTLNVPSGNNHFSDAGGRNGEYEDREVANRDWIARALTDARRRRAKALVFFFQADPVSLAAGRRARTGFAAWFGGRPEHDGYAALRRDLRTTAEAFAGPVLVIHTGVVTGAQSKEPPGQHKMPRSVLFMEPLLRPSRNGKPLRNLVHLQIQTPTPDNQWLRVSFRVRRGADTPSFHATLETAPTHLPVDVTPLPDNANGFNDEDPLSSDAPANGGPGGITDPGHATQMGHSGSGQAANAGNAVTSGTTPAPATRPTDARNAANATSASTTTFASDVMGSYGADASGSTTPQDQGTSAVPPFPTAATQGTQDVTGAPVYDDGNDGWAGLPQEPHTLIDPSSVLGDISRPVLLPLPPQTTSPLGPPAR